MMARFPQIIQGGMGLGVSNWKLARAVSLAGQLGVVSGMALDNILIRRLQSGDSGGHLRCALDHFPWPEVSNRIYEKYFSPSAPARFSCAPLLSAELTIEQAQLLAVANFAEVFLAKKNHQGIVGINYLEKVQLPLLPSIYGAMLAGVDFVLMGAGIPREIPRVLDELASGSDSHYKLNVSGSTSETVLRFSPQQAFGERRCAHRPQFLAIVSSHVLAQTLAKKSAPPDGFVLEHAAAGGHNAPPRGALKLNENGEPVYGPRDEIDYQAITNLNKPFWMAGGFAGSQGLKKALTMGAQGIQVGTAFALSQDSGLSAELKSQIIEKILKDKLDVFTDPLASPTGFPFKVVRLNNTLSEQEIYQKRVRRCDLGYLREAYMDAGKIKYRCPGEPIEIYLKKGGKLEDTVGRKCLCNGLMANVDLGQKLSDGSQELPLVTLASETSFVKELAIEKGMEFSAANVIEEMTRL